MERHFLLTVSDQQSSFCGARFLGYFFTNKEDLRITLYYTAPKPAAVWKDEQTRETEDQAKAQAERFKAKGLEAIDAAKTTLCRMGFPEEMIETKLTFRKRTKVKDIISEGMEGRYDAVVLGRRGLSWLEEVFSDSVSKELMETPVHFPIWFCRKPRESSKNVLICLDGSDPAYRMVDHAGFVLAKQPDQEITLFVVNDGKQFSGDEAETLFYKAEGLLLDNGFPEDRIKTKIADDSNISRAIIKELDEGGYGTVALGRGDPDRGFFMGSVCEKLFREVEQTAMWIAY